MNSTLLRIVVLVLVSVLAVIANADRANRYGSSLFANGVAAVVGESDPEVSIEMLTDAADPPVNTQTGIFKSTAARPSGTPIPACALPVLPHSGGATSSAQAPSTRYARSRGVYLIRATELAAAGYLPGSSPTILEWNYQTGPGILGSAPLRIYLENTTDTNYTKPLSFNSALAGMTPVHNATTMLPATAGIFDVYFSGGVPFTYTGGGLYVAFDWGPYEGTRSTTAKVYYALGFANGFAGNSTGDDALTANSLRPETRLNGSPSPQFDAAVSTVYSIGEIPLGRAPLQTISALVTNNGTQSLTDLPVTLNISGSHTFTDTQVLPFLGSCGRQAMVTFNLFEPTTLGSDTVTVSVPADEVSANNSVSKALNVTANEYSYRYPGSTANGAVGLGAPGVYAAKFAVPSAESVEAVKLEFWVVTAATYRIAIFADNGGSPSNIPLYVDSFDRTIDAAGVITITLPTPVAVHGTFYVGMYQTSTEPAFIALESEIPLRTGTFFRSDSSFQPWFDVSPSRYKFNIGVVLNNSQGTSTPTNTATPAVTPTSLPVINGRIAFVRNSDIYTINSDGSDQSNITNNVAVDTEPNYSPDGLKIIFVSDRDGNNEIYQMNQAGGAVVRLTNDTSSESSPEYSPDGASIVFVSNRDGNNEIYKMNSDGTNPVRLTTESTSDLSPSFSPDGSKIIFVSRRIPAARLFTMNSDGSDPQVISDIDGFYTDPSYSSDRTKIIFIYGVDATQQRIWTMNADGTNRVQFPAFGINSSSYSPDGQKVVYKSLQSGIFTSNADGSSPVNISNGSFDAFPDWQPVPTTRRTAFDYDGDHKTDISVFRQSEGAWYLAQSQAGVFGAQFGLSSDKITPADFDGDGKTDIAVYRPSTGIWYLLNSADGTVSYYQFGLAEDLPTPADYDGDGKADVSVFRASTGTWYRQNSGNGTFFAVQFGASEDKPTVGDFDGDGKSDIAVFRPSSGAWYQIYSSDGSIHGENFGFGSDILVPADYDGDGKTDVAVFRPSDGYWYARNSSDGAFTYKIFGLATDIPAPCDFDGDGKADINVFRPSDGTWYRQNSSNGAFVAFPFGTNGDKPTMSAFRY